MIIFTANSLIYLFGDHYFKAFHIFMVGRLYGFYIFFLFLVVSSSDLSLVAFPAFFFHILTNLQTPKNTNRAKNMLLRKELQEFAEQTTLFQIRAY